MVVPETFPVSESLLVVRASELIRTPGACDSPETEISLSSVVPGVVSGVSTDSDALSLCVVGGEAGSSSGGANMSFFFSSDGAGVGAAAGGAGVGAVTGGASIGTEGTVEESTGGFPCVCFSTPPLAGVTGGIGITGGCGPGVTGCLRLQASSACWAICRTRADASLKQP